MGQSPCRKSTTRREKRRRAKEGAGGKREKQHQKEGVSWTKASKKDDTGRRAPAQLTEATSGNLNLEESCEQVVHGGV